MITTRAPDGANKEPINQNFRGLVELRQCLLITRVLRVLVRLAVAHKREVHFIFSFNQKVKFVLKPTMKNGCTSAEQRTKVIHIALIPGLLWLKYNEYK